MQLLLSCRSLCGDKRIVSLREGWKGGKKLETRYAARFPIDKLRRAVGRLAEVQVGTDRVAAGLRESN
jgi:hypothetical protein